MEWSIRNSTKDLLNNFDKYKRFDLAIERLKSLVFDDHCGFYLEICKSLKIRANLFDALISICWIWMAPTAESSVKYSLQACNSKESFLAFADKHSKTNKEYQGIIDLDNFNHASGECTQMDIDTVIAIKTDLNVGRDQLSKHNTISLSLQNKWHQIIAETALKHAN